MKNDYGLHDDEIVCEHYGYVTKLFVPTTRHVFYTGKPVANVADIVTPSSTNKVLIANEFYVVINIDFKNKQLRKIPIKGNNECQFLDQCKMSGFWLHPKEDVIIDLSNETSGIAYPTILKTSFVQCINGTRVVFLDYFNAN